MAYFSYNFADKTISQIGFNSKNTKKTESIFSQGNGYLGIRSVDEERDSYNKEDFFVNGIFNKDNEDEVSELANLADSLQTTIILDDKVVSLYSVIEYIKTLELETGELKREISFEVNDKKFQINFQRIVDQVNLNFYMQRITIKQLIGEPTKLAVFPLINGQTTNNGNQHFKEGLKKMINNISIQYQEESTFSKRYVVHNMIIRAMADGKMLYSGNNNYVIRMGRRQIGFRIIDQVAVNKPFVIEKLMCVTTSIDYANRILTKDETLKKSFEDFKQLEVLSYDKTLASNQKAYEKIYDSFYLKIQGDSEEAKYDQLGLLFSLYHINNFIPKNNSNISVGAKGLSGEGYQGHCYWDTEFFIVPNYIHTNPTIAKNLLEYRYKGIAGARAKAAENHFKGAQYPWEMAWPTDGEQTPYWGQPDIRTGEQIPIASRQQEIHPSGDIAFCVNLYYEATGDEDFMYRMGYEMVIDTAIFWSERAEFRNGAYHITNVMGPNEYKGNINNNNFINRIAKRNLELAIKYINYLSNSGHGNALFLQDLNRRIPYAYNVDKLIHVAQALVQQEPNKDLIIPENDQFLWLPKSDVRPFQFLGDAGKTLFNTWEGQVRLSSQLCKQADVVLTTFIFGELFSKDVVLKNFEYYEPLTTHDSSLSPSTYSIIANDLGKTEQAYKLFKYALNIDLGTNFDSSDQGIHAGSMGAIWQTIVYGFGGFRFLDNKISFKPRLPKEWNSLDYALLLKGRKIFVSINHENFNIRLLEGEELKCYVNDQEVNITKQSQIFQVTKNA